MRVRRAVPEDRESVVSMWQRLWPGSPRDEHRSEVSGILAGEPPSTLPLVLFVAAEQDSIVGFIEVGLRSHADGCDPSRPCGFIEGWYVLPEYQRRGIGRLLMEAAESWAREQGSIEIASDTWIDNEASQRAHTALGFEVVERCVNFRKRLGDPTETLAGARPFYGAELAGVHHEHFGMVARAAARELLARLATARIVSGTILDLAAGTGILSRAVMEAGFDVWGVDISEQMLSIARVEAKNARFSCGSLWHVALPPCVAVAAIGEAFSYAADPIAGSSALEARLAAIHAALSPGGLLLFDVASPGRSGPERARRVFWSRNGMHLGLEEHEDTDKRLLKRRITLFVRQGTLFRSVEETHELRLYSPEEIGELLTKIGFGWERLSGYDDYALSPGWHAYAAAKGSP